MHGTRDPQRIAAGVIVDGGDMNRKRRKTSIGRQFVPRIAEMLESPAFRVLSQGGHRVLARLELEHAHHGGAENGSLPVTFGDFERYGMDHQSVAPAQREVQALGFAEITERGRPSESDFGRHPHHWRLTYLHGAYGEIPTDEWKRHKTLKEARRVAKAARNAKDERAVAKSKEKAAKKTDAGGGKIRTAGLETHPVNANVPGGKSHPTVTGLETHPTIYISDRDEDAA
jgi:hypothetical protein